MIRKSGLWKRKKLAAKATLWREIRTIRLHSPISAMHDLARSGAARLEGTKTAPEEAVSAEPISNMIGKDTRAISLWPGISDIRVDGILCPTDAYQAMTTT